MQQTDNFYKRISTMRSEIGGLRAAVNAKDQKIARLEARLEKSVPRDDLDTHDRQYLEKIHEQEEYITSLERGEAHGKQFRDKDRECRKLASENASLKKRVSSQKASLETETRRKVSYREKSRKKDEELRAAKKKIAELEETVRRKEAVILAQYKDLADKKEKIDSLLSRLKKNHTNSSIPSSHDPVGGAGEAGGSSQEDGGDGRRKKICNSRTSTGRNPGKQPGEPGAKRPAPPEEGKEGVCPVQLKLPEPGTKDAAGKEPEAWGSPLSAWIPTGKTKERWEMDIEIKPVWKKYISYEYKSLVTGGTRYMDFPPTVVNEMNYAPHYKALMLYLLDGCNVPVKKVSDFFGLLADRQSIPSSGMVCSLPGQFSGLLDNYKKEKLERMLDLDGLHVDHTPVKLNGKHMQVLVLRHKQEGTVYIVSESKGLDSLGKTPLRDYVHTLIHDHASVFYHFGTSHQECLAHVLRYLLNASELDSRLTWAAKMHDLVTEMIDAVNQSPTSTVTAQEAAAYRRRYEQILDIADREYTRYPPGKYNRDGFNLAVKMRAYEDDHLTFLTNPDVDPTNNEAESAARKVKVLMRRKGTWRNKVNIQYDCDVIMVLEDARLRGADPVKALAEIFRTKGEIPEELNCYAPQERKKAAA